MFCLFKCSSKFLPRILAHFRNAMKPWTSHWNDKRSICAVVLHRGIRGLFWMLESPVSPNFAVISILSIVSKAGGEIQYKIIYFFKCIQYFTLSFNKRMLSLIQNVYFACSLNYNVVVCLPGNDLILYLQVTKNTKI